jgi:two-component system, OmpR family, sensor histidine kinase VicK
MYDGDEGKSKILRTELVHGSENVVDFLVEFMYKAKLRIDICVDYTRPGLCIEIRKLMSAFIDAKKRQVKIRYITEMTKDNLDYCKKLIPIVDEFRHLNGIKGNFYVSEVEYAAPSTLHEKGKSSEMMIYSNIKEIVEHQQYIFDSFWSKAILAEQKVKEIEEGIEPEYFEVFTYRDRERVSQILFRPSKSVKKEALVLLPNVKSLIRVDRLGLIDHVIDASLRGATVKIICPLSEENSKVTRKIKERASAVKVINGNNTPYGMYIIDGEKFLKAEVREPEAETFSEAIGFCVYSNSKLSVNSFRSIFDLLWNQHTINEELKRADKMQRQFINIAAYELRTPIQPMLAMLRLRWKTNITKDELDESLDLMIRNAMRLKQLSEDILDVTIIESQSLNLRKEICDLNDLVRGTIDEYKRNQVIQSKNHIDIKYASSYAEVFVDVDKSRIAQVISNLLSNAFKFSKEGSIIVNIEPYERNSREVTVTVKDSGRGIDAEVITRLFEKFVSKSFQGTGVGLYISKNIVEGHGGRIWAENNADGKGATFYFTLPIIKSISHNANDNSNKQKRILIVDDEPDVNTVLKKVLEQGGFNVDSYDDPILALENFKAGSYDILLLDVKMPEMDGFQLYKKMKRIDSKVKVCFLTASEMYYERFRNEEELNEIPRDLFLQKPIENEDLIKKLNMIISQEHNYK